MPAILIETLDDDTTQESIMPHLYPYSAKMSSGQKMWRHGACCPAPWRPQNIRNAGQRDFRQGRQDKARPAAVTSYLLKSKSVAIFACFLLGVSSYTHCTTRTESVPFLRLSVGSSRLIQLDKSISTPGS